MSKGKVQTVGGIWPYSCLSVTNRPRQSRWCCYRKTKKTVRSQNISGMFIVDQSLVRPWNRRIQMVCIRLGTTLVPVLFLSYFIFQARPGVLEIRYLGCFMPRLSVFFGQNLQVWGISITITLGICYQRFCTYLCCIFLCILYFFAIPGERNHFAVCENDYISASSIIDTACLKLLKISNRLFLCQLFSSVPPNLTLLQKAILLNWI